MIETNRIPNDWTTFIIKIIHQVFGLIITAMSFNLKVPQIYTIYKKKSVKGLSVLSNYFDFYSILFQGLYGLHKNMTYLVYLENFVSTVQNTTIIFQSWYYAEKKPDKKELLLRIIFLITTPLLLIITTINNGDYLSEYIWTILVCLGLPFMTISRVDQMKKIYTEKNVGSISVTSFIFRAIKNYMKVFVISAEKLNWQLILNQGWYGILTTGVIILYYMYKDYQQPKEVQKAS